MNLSGLIKFLTGFALAIALLFFAGATATRFVMTRLATPPPKPIFPNDSPAVAQASATSDTAPSSSSSEPSEPGAYEARVTEPIGLVLREGPSRDADRIGGVDYNQPVTVLETSSDGDWMRIRLEGSDIEGWVKAGNTERVD